MINPYEQFQHDLCTCGVVTDEHHTLELFCPKCSQCKIEREMICEEYFAARCAKREEMRVDLVEHGSSF
jgi:hypothetical protein